MINYYHYCYYYYCYYYYLGFFGSAGSLARILFPLLAGFSAHVYNDNYIFFMMFVILIIAFFVYSYSMVTIFDVIHSN